jgi:hypothetical protein
MKIVKPAKSQTKATKVPASVPAKAKKPGVFKTWIVALEKFGRGKDPVKNIASYLHQQFPNRKTNWAKWANLIRQRYNRGAFVKGEKPSKAIPLFKLAKAS